MKMFFQIVTLITILLFKLNAYALSSSPCPPKDAFSSDFTMAFSDEEENHWTLISNFTYQQRHWMGFFEFISNQNAQTEDEAIQEGKKRLKQISLNEPVIVGSSCLYVRNEDYPHHYYSVLALPGS